MDFDEDVRIEDLSKKEFKKFIKQARKEIKELEYIKTLPFFRKIIFLSNDKAIKATKKYWKRMQNIKIKKRKE